jgi:cobalt/nickel transport system permease protein
MHIPDGYLSPATCTALYASSAPFWYVAMQRVKKTLHTRLVPLLSLFAAFSFVIMMFNLPLPGGTTGHAVGIGLATVVLGPWAAMLAVSVAIVIQALFFGDGGITAIGANCFNMAIVGALVSYAVYRMLAGRSAILSFRRVVSAGLAGYAAINVSALLAAIEFGIQPLLYRDAAGAPLYCPYPLSVAIPAMMLGHLTIAGLAELVVSAGVVAFIQKSDPSLLKSTAGRGVLLTEPPARAGGYSPRPGRAGGLAAGSSGPTAHSGSHSLRPGNAGGLAAGSSHPTVRAGARSLRPLWLGLCLLMILTPLGILAAGSAWGEWMASDYGNPAVRRQIAQSSFQQPAPQRAPEGLERLSSLWTAPFGRYAPPYVTNPAFGYLLSAMFGVGLIMLATLAVGRFIRAQSYDSEERAA